MTDINRRMLLGAVSVAGASLALTGCGSRPRGDAMPSGEDNTGMGNDSDQAGSCAPYGEEVDVTQSSVTNASFSPDHVCALYIKYQNGKPIVRHAYSELGGSWDDSHVMNVAVALLQALRDYNPAKPQPYPVSVKWPRYNFDNFSMGSQQVLVILVDNRPDVIRFNDDPTKQRIIRFTKFSGTLDPGPIPYPDRQENHAFYDLRPLRLTGAGFETDLAYRLNFWNLDGTGTEMTGVNKPNPNDRKTWKIYSMNIHLLQTVAFPTAKFDDGSMVISTIPTILDPDTGNMGSNP